MVLSSELEGASLSFAELGTAQPQLVYSFDGKPNQQLEGGPIGFRSTCVIAKLVMNLFDVKLEDNLSKMGIDTWLNI